MLQSRCDADVEAFEGAGKYVDEGLIRSCHFPLSYCYSRRNARILPLQQAQGQNDDKKGRWTTKLPCRDHSLTTGVRHRPTLHLTGRFGRGVVEVFDRRSLVRGAPGTHAGRRITHYDHRDVRKYYAERRRRLDRPQGCTLYLSGSPPLIRGGVFLRAVFAIALREGATSLVACDFGGEDADIFDAAVVLGVVHAVADDELVGDFEGYVVGLDGDEAALGFVEAGGDFE